MTDFIPYIGFYIFNNVSLCDGKIEKIYYMVYYINFINLMLYMLSCNFKILNDMALSLNDVTSYVLLDVTKENIDLKIYLFYFNFIM
jgi:hypothetical protein